jgi:phosphate transport system substrate-binding protein
MNRQIVWCTLLLVSLLLFWSCGKERKDTYSSGETTVYVSESIQPMIEQQVRDFQKMYPNAIIHLKTTTDRDAIVRLINGETKLAIVARDLNPEEQLVIRQNKLSVNQIRFGIDAIAVIVNEKNLIDSLTTQQITAMFRGKTSDWRQIQKNLSGHIVHAITGANTATYEFLNRTLLNGQSPNCTIFPCTTSTQVIRYIEENQDAIGYVGLNWLTGTTRQNEKILKIGDATISYDSVSNSRTLLPHQFYIWKRVYPFTRDLWALSTDKDAGLPAGFTVYLMSVPGQKTVLNAGMVPGNTRMPITLVPAGSR